MRAAALTVMAGVALLAFAPASAVAPEEASLEVSFQPPAEGGPRLQADSSTWLLLLLGDGMSATGDVAFESPVTWTSHEETRATAFAPVTGNVSHPTQPVAGSPRATALTGPVLAGLGSLYLEADHIAWTVDRSSSQLLAHDGQCLDLAVGPQPLSDRWGRFEAMCPAEGAAFASAAALGSPGIDVHLEATGVRRIESHGAAFTCAGPCPDGDDRRTTQVGTTGARERQFTFHEMVGSDGRLVLDGQAFGLHAAGSAATVVGSMRFPLADAAACAGCIIADDQTLRVDGTLRIEQVRVQPDGNLAARLSGSVASARVDETAVDVQALLGTGAVAVAAAGAAAAGALLLVKSVLLPLFTRMGKDRALDHPRREAAYLFIQSNPGVTFGDVAAHVGMAAGPAHHHLAILERSRLVTRRSHGRSTRFFQAGARPAGDWRQATALRDPRLRRLFDLIHASPETTQKELLARMEGEGWKRSTTQHRLSRLLAAGLVRADRVGRTQRYTTSPPPEAPSGLAAAAGVGPLVDLATTRSPSAAAEPARASP